MRKFIRSSFALTILMSIYGFGTHESTLRNTLYKDCEILHEGTFKYGNTDDEIKVVIDGKDHTEYHNGGKYIIKSKLEWVNDCEYNMTMTKVTIPDFPYGKGDIMNVKVIEVRGNEITYTSTIEGQSWNGKLIKIS